MTADRQRRGTPCARCGHLKGEHRGSTIRIGGRQFWILRECRVDAVAPNAEPCDCPEYQTPADPERLSDEDLSWVVGSMREVLRRYGGHRYARIFDQLLREREAGGQA